MAWHDNRPWASTIVAALFVTAACEAGPTASPRASPTPSPTASPTATPTGRPTPTEPGPSPISTIGEGEGALDLIVRPGYAERGANDSAYDWVTPFEKETGCRVSVYEAGTSEQLLSRVVEEGGARWDGVSAPGDVALRLVHEGLVEPLDAQALFPAWTGIWAPLRRPAYSTVGGVHYGVAQGWGANLLMWNSSVVSPDPTSWQVLHDPASPYRGRITGYDTPISIADAALYLRRVRPELAITDPYELSAEQFDAAVELLKAQRPLIGTYWGTPLDEIGAFEDGSAVIGSAWPNQLRFLQTGDPPVPVEATRPVEGATAWAVSWMLLAGAEHPNCMLRWIGWMTSPAVQKQVAEYAVEAPANAQACPLLDDAPGPFGFAGWCAFHQATDEAMAHLRFWKTPLSDCGDGRGEACVDYAIWAQQWDEVKAATSTPTP